MLPVSDGSQSSESTAATLVGGSLASLRGTVIGMGEYASLAAALASCRFPRGDDSGFPRYARLYEVLVRSIWWADPRYRSPLYHLTVVINQHDEQARSSESFTHCHGPNQQRSYRPSRWSPEPMHIRPHCGFSQGGDAVHASQLDKVSHFEDWLKLPCLTRALKHG